MGFIDRPFFIDEKEFKRRIGIIYEFLYLIRKLFP